MTEVSKITTSMFDQALLAIAQRMAADYTFQADLVRMELDLLRDILPRVSRDNRYIGPIADACDWLLENPSRKADSTGFNGWARGMYELRAAVVVHAQARAANVIDQLQSTGELPSPVPETGDAA